MESEATPAAVARLSRIGTGYARTSVNASAFRKNSVVSHGNRQVAAYYDAEGRVVIARRQLGRDRWERHVTQYAGNVDDAHNAISIAVDGEGVLHAAWDHHGGALNYARGTAPGALSLGPREAMTGKDESSVTYPQFYNLASGDLLMLYRDGASGRGNVILNRYDVASRRWRPLAHPLIDGEGARNAYLNTMAIDARGRWHLSWTWRETPDVASNHDVLYAVSPDEGASWLRSDGSRYELPITRSTAEVAWTVPQDRELINQTSMTVDAAGRPVVATYWRAPGEGAPQFRIVWHDGARWRMNSIGRRLSPFHLSGTGTRRIPVSRPQVLAGPDTALYVVLRDAERGEGVRVAMSTDTSRTDWQFKAISGVPVGQWEPTYDPLLWKRDGLLHLFHQPVGQGAGDTEEDVAPQPVSILEWRPR